MIAGRRFLLVVLLALAPSGAAAHEVAAPADATARPRNVILMIPDGCGPAAITLARLVSGHPLALDSLLVGAVETHSADSHVTDSAAGATAYATGVKTRNRMIGVDPDERPLGTLVEVAEARGLRGPRRPAHHAGLDRCPDAPAPSGPSARWRPVALATGRGGRQAP